MKTSKKIQQQKDRITHFTGANRNGTTMQLTKVVNKKVTNPVSGLKVNRKANITITVPDYTVIKTTVEGKTVETVAGLTIQNAIATFGSTEKLIQYAIAGFWAHVRTNESNALGAADKSTRMLAKAAKALKSVIPGLSDEALRAMLMSNPEYAKSFEATTFELEISKTVDIADLEAPVLDPSDSKDESAEEDETEDAA